MDRGEDEPCEGRAAGDGGGRGAVGAGGDRPARAGRARARADRAGGRRLRLREPVRAALAPSASGLRLPC